eukprot:5795654-Heterocapsa_arctica.AAC.1
MRELEGLTRNRPGPSNMPAPMPGFLVAQHTHDAEPSSFGLTQTGSDREDIGPSGSTTTHHHQEGDDISSEAFSPQVGTTLDNNTQ